jgi:ferritin-like metal-binding protein YciE
MKLNSLQELLITELQDLLSAERQLLQIFPKMILSAGHAELREALEEHQRETAIQERRLEQCLRTLEVPAKPVRSHGMVGLVSAWMEFQSSEVQADVRDASTISLLQRMEHYEIAGYGCARAFAETLDLHEIGGLLKETLLEEERFDRKLTRIAESVVNRDAELQAK